MEKDTNKWLITDLYLKDSLINAINEKAENGDFAASFCCVFFSIKGFDSYYMRNGFDEGYEVLLFVANKIKNCFPVDLVGKFEDDQFVVFTDIDDIERFIKKIRMDFDEVYIHTGMEIKAGIYAIDPNDRNGLEIVENAKIACDLCDSSQSDFSIFDKDDVDEKILMQHYVVHHLEDALKNGEIAVYYQPIFHTLSGKVCGLEALARWKNDEYGFLLPYDFVPVLENSRKIHLLDAFVIKQVCKDQRIVIDRGMEPVPVSINLTKLDFLLIDVLELLKEELEKNNLTNDLIQIEISEAEITRDKKGIKKELEKFKENGFHIVFDDFGSEYSALQAIRDMPFDTIKINSNFLSGFNNDLTSRIILKNILNLSKELGMTTMMGAVEDEEVLEFLKQTGCEKTQGHLYSEARPLDYYDDGSYPYEYETFEERDFYREIGKVNILSQTPIEYRNSNHEDEFTYLNQLPLAIMEFNGRKFRILMTSRDFDEVISDMFIDGLYNAEMVFNDKLNPFSKQLRDLARNSSKDDEIHAMEFVTGKGFHRIMLRRIVDDSIGNKAALIATIETLTKNDPETRAAKLNNSLRFLYPLYTRIARTQIDTDEFDIIYENKTKYGVSLSDCKFSEAIVKFANEAIYNEDRTAFISFFDCSTLDERLAEFGTDHLTDYFRTIDVNGEYNWLMYLIVPIISEGSKMFLMCSRSIDAERMRKLPEISQSGSEYYDMPSDPIYLLLASDAFTDTLGYGSFEQFIRNTFFLEASLTDDQTIYMHLGQSGLISDFGETGYISLPFGEVIKSMVFSQVIEEDRDKMYEFYDKDRLIAEYEKGNISGKIVYLQRTGASDKPRYQNACYQIRKNRDGDNIHVYILTYDVDEFKRTNETIRNLAERDVLTGLFNRMTITRVVENIMNDPETQNFAMVLLDLDFFKQFNDNYGHDCGDKVLQDASERMKKYMGDDSYPARIGGDEFMVIIRNKTQPEVDKILSDFSTMDKSFEYKGQKVTYTMSIGYALCPDDGTNYNSLYQNADKALYKVKESGRNNYGQYIKSEQKEDK